jgi:sugar (glycoside-pentoside-hexuronide) transporter
MQDYNKKYLTRTNVFSFAAGGFGQNMIIGIVNSFILFFYTDILLIPTAAVTVLMASARIFDALNDPIMGIIVDKTRSRWGKLRPYIFATVLPLAIITTLLFYAPDLSEKGKIVYAYITYFSFGIIYTICDVPFWGLASAMTPNPEERVRFISFSRLFHSVGGALPILLVPMFVSLAGGSNRKGYFSAGLFVGIVGAALFSLAFFGTKERCVQSEKAPTLKDNIKFFLINRPLQLVVGANILGAGRAIAMVASMYIAVYLLGNPSLNIIVLGSFGVTGYLGMLITPLLAKKINYRQMYIMCTIIGVTANALMFVWGQSMAAILVCMVIAGFPYGVASNINYAMIADSVDYVEWKTGKRTEGVSVSFQTLMNKLMSALQVAGTAYALKIVGFKQPVMIDGEPVTQVQTQGTLNGIFFVISIIPMVSWIIGLAPMLFYTFIGEKRQIAHRAIIDMRNQIGAKAEGQGVGCEDIEFFEEY